MICHGKNEYALPSSQFQHHVPGLVHKPHLAARHRHKKHIQPPRTSLAPQPDESSLISKVGNTTECSPLAVTARNLKFCCQLAQGSLLRLFPTSLPCTSCFNRSPTASTSLQMTSSFAQLTHSSLIWINSLPGPWSTQICCSLM